MKILVTGANGMVARAVTAHSKSLGDDVVALTREQLDIADKQGVIDRLRNEKFDTVINCAASTNVDGCETDTQRNYDANAYGVENLAIGCRVSGASLVTISTDYVFDGAKSGFYTQRDDPNPQSKYGMAKLQGERLAHAALARTIVVRAGWIFGPHGTNFLSKVAGLLRRGEPVKAIHDSFGTPTYAPDLAERLRELAMLDLPGTYHVANTGEGTSYAGFARAVSPDPDLIHDISAHSLERPAPRPANSCLRCLISEPLGLAPLRPWEQAVREFVDIDKIASEQ